MNHDDYYIQYLQSMFGNASVSFFGIILTVISLILISIVILLNSTTVFVTPVGGSNSGSSSNSAPLMKLPTTKPFVI
ncbi:hypothetical protein HgNV_003 [Homarus gammarus nudivirus]|uniref:Uncharacterized protein n=1 Tax=Homarus gammarus nudivirus TaxID=2509616 RepID=A0A411HB32_9VIRU|nr:hypothetical protein KM727_gp03 [Homarus gammarus nudivirus]QBB28608.1 hypothetical protein HgNV_003 [Homarus gammarus nudivirus]